MDRAHRLIAAFAAALLLAFPAAADQCLDETAVWSQPYFTGSIQAVTYYVWQQAPPGPGTPPPLLAVLSRTGDYHLYNNVPQSVAQRFSTVTTGEATFNSYIRGRYLQLLLAEDLCPLRNETTSAYLLSETP